MSFLQKLNNLSNRMKYGVSTLSNDSKNTLWDGHSVQKIIKKFSGTTSTTSTSAVATLYTASIIPKFQNSILRIATSFNMLQVESHSETNITIQLFDNFDGAGWNIVSNDYRNMGYRNYSSPSGDWGMAFQSLEWFVDLSTDGNISPGKTKIEYKVYMFVSGGTGVFGNQTTNGKSWFSIEELQGCNYNT